MNHFLIGLWRMIKSWHTTGNHQLSGWTEKQLQSTSQSQTSTKKRSRSLFGGLLPVWATIAFWTQQNHYIWAVCSAGQWGALNTAAPAACIGQQNGLRSSPRQCPTTRCTTSASNAEWIGLWHFPSSTAVTWPLTNWWPLLQASQQHFAGKMLPQPVGCRKCIPRVLWILSYRFLCHRDKLISHWKNCVDCNHSYLINKNVFEPSYNDLKFTTWNRNYICMNLTRENLCNIKSGRFLR